MTWELSDTIAAVIMEPIITGGGVLIPHDDYMKGVKEVCEKHGALLIVMKSFVDLVVQVNLLVL